MKILAKLYLLLIPSIYCASGETYNLSYLTPLTVSGVPLESKSYIGWARVIKNPAKRKEYHLENLTDDEVNFLVNTLLELEKQNKIEGKLK